MRGKFIVVEGGDGCGKGTQVNALVKELNDRGIHAVAVGTYTSTEVGQRVREIIVSTKGKLDIRVRIGLLMSAHRALLTEVIEPLTAKGVTCVCDRYFHSSLVYQGEIERAGMQRVQGMQKALGVNKSPDLTLIMSVNAHESVRRLYARKDIKRDDMDSDDVDLHAQIRLAYLSLPRFLNRDVISIIDGMGTPEEVTQQMLEAISGNMIFNLRGGHAKRAG